MIHDYYTDCPHCGCRCEDDEYCAACNRLFDEEDTSTQNVSIIGTLASGLCSVFEKKDSSFMDEPDATLDPDFSLLSGNIFNHDRYK